MKFALAIQSANQIPNLEHPWKMEEISTLELETLHHVQRVLQSFFETPAFSHLYMGSEFCQYRLPKVDDLVNAYKRSIQSGLSFTFVTPYVTESGLENLKQLLDALHEEVSRNDDSVEVVVNDWGVFYQITQNYRHFQPVIGRLLNKMIRDPRVAHLYDRPDAPKRANAVLQKQAVGASYFKTFLQANKVKRIEFDNLIQTMENTVREEDFSSSLHIGYGCIATGRSCLVGTMHKPKEQKFKGEMKCKQQCQHYQAELVSKKERLGELPTRNIQKGNSVFYQQTNELIEKGVRWAIEHKVDRIVISPRVPV